MINEDAVRRFAQDYGDILGVQLVAILTYNSFKHNANPDLPH